MSRRLGPGLLRLALLGGLAALAAAAALLLGGRDAAADACAWGAPARAQWRPQGESRELVLMLHAYTRSPGSLCQVEALLRRQPGGEHADVWIPELPFGTFSREPMDAVVEQLVAALDARWQARAAQGRPYERLRIVGHSLGSLLARKVYLAGLGAPGSDPGQARPWALRTERILLLAGINRGWRIDHHMAPLNAAYYQAGLWLNDWLRAAGAAPFTVMAGQQGSAFVNQMRLQWQRLPARWAELAAAQPLRPLVVQLLGTVDDIVPPSSNVDAATGTDFVYLSMPRSGHTDVVQVLADADDPAAPALRAAVMARAWRERPAALAGATESPEQALARLRAHFEADAVPLAVRQARQDGAVRHVVFVMHGIRDEGHWTERVAASVEQALCRAEGCTPGPASGVVFEIASYGYFPMLSFLRPGARQDKVAWLFDRYAEARARYPAATFHYIGHSHGTYLLKEALEQLPEVRFERVVLAGSVLRRREDWARFLGSGQVGRLLNLRAHADWVVAIFPNTMEKLGLQDLGGAGHLGFEQQVAGLVHGPLHEGRYGFVQGDHGSGVNEHAWQTIGRFVASGEADYAGLATEPALAPWVDWAGRWGLLLWGLIAALLAWGAWRLLRWPVREAVKTLALVAYAGLIWMVLTRV